MSDIRSEGEAFPPQQSDANRTVLVGNSSNPVSIQLVQEIFREITGKSEALTTSFNEPYQIEFENIQDLHYKIQQTLEQYKVHSENCSVNIYYLNNSKDELKSFDRFALQNAGSSSPVESVFIKYDFLIIPSKSNKAQSYSISVRIASSVAIRKRMENETFLGVPPNILRLMGNRSAYSKIEYIDYTVARNVQTAINEWFSVLPCEEKNAVASFFQKKAI